MDILASVITSVNVVINALSRFLLAPVGKVPGWFSITVISAVMGLVLMIIYKYTSNQTALGRVGDHIKANLLALKLFKDSLTVTFHAMGQVFKGALLRLLYSIQPMLFMIVPISLLLAQMGLWYQARPLLPSEETIVTMELNNDADSSWPQISIDSMPSAEVIAGPVRVQSKRQVYWQIKAIENSNTPIVFQVGAEKIEKELVIGDVFMQVSMTRPGQRWSDILLHPLEKPFTSDSVVKSISIDYPGRSSWIYGSDWWVIYFFIASMVFALVFKPFLKVRI